MNLNPQFRLRTKRAVMALAGLILAALAAFLPWRGEPSETEPAAGGIKEAPSASMEEFVAVSKPLPEPPPPRPRQAWQEFAPSEVIGSLDCSMLAGRGHAKEVALVILPAANGARFAALDGQGTLFGDALPFKPNFYRLGRRADGTVLAGFGALELISPVVLKDLNAPEPVRIYADGRVLYETDKAWEFGIARDGSSFFVHEPLAGGTSRLIVHNLDQGLEHHFDLGAKFTPLSRYSEFLPEATYSTDASEVIFSPSYHPDDFGLGEHWFFPVDGGAVRSILAERGAPFDPVGDEAPKIRVPGARGALFASSEEAYFAHLLEWKGRAMAEPWRIVRRSFRFGAQETQSEVWSQEIAIKGFSGNLRLSGDGAWLAVQSWTLLVLDATTGETVFKFPFADKQAELARLASVMEPGAGLESLGWVGASSVEFRNGNLEMFRQIGSSDSCRRREGRRAVYECQRALREQGLYREVLDVFDMSKIQLDSQPDFRVEVGRDIPCSSGDYSPRGLQVHEGRLTFLTTRRS